MATILNHLDTIIISIVAVILGWDRLRSGSNNLRKEIAADYKERNLQLEEKIKEFEHQLNETNIKLATVTASLAEKDKHITSLTEILQGRNPETLALLTEISQSNIEIKNFMQLMHDDSKRERKHQTDILEGQVRREKNIDDSSAAGTGDPMRTSSKGNK
jgi:chromosome segregation ATPase